MKKQQVHVAIKASHDSDSPYRWSVCFLSLAAREAKRFLNDVEYGFVIDHVRLLACEDDPTKPATVSVDAIDDVHELRIKGGLLGKKNVRLFFFVHSGRLIVLLGCVKKESEGSLPPATKKLMSVRKRKFLEGAYGSIGGTE